MYTSPYTYMPYPQVAYPIEQEVAPQNLHNNTMNPLSLAIKTYEEVSNKTFVPFKHNKVYPVLSLPCTSVNSENCRDS